MLEVLQTKNQISEARRVMARRGLSTLEGAVSKFLRRFGLNSGLLVGDYIKSWDVLQTLGFIESHLSRDAAILDLGAFCSEVPVALGRMGYAQVHGIDLNPALKSMPDADKIKYDIGNFMSTPYPDASFDAITAISVIEHGYEPERLYSEISRLLRPGGYFIASFDYWPDKIDIGTTTFFDMSWLIFSQGDVEEMLKMASRHGLQPVGGLQPAAKEQAVHCIGYDYTFAWLALQKT
ncbi:MAG: methyltransferase domain-containing protein [Thiobacillus sp.]|uniref:methyltransferase domain-containing protein n=1 Tax=Thiobacillus sp. TaxID=924 RepID=UPI00168C86B5|nr:methyltransferase domain-containing protein [Thiobacillus sp.]QLQ04221.1 MAG: methyltransferase domain-containing protein [Thiobacillus sp.]